MSSLLESGRKIHGVTNDDSFCVVVVGGFDAKVHADKLNGHSLVVGGSAAFFARVNALSPFVRGDHDEVVFVSTCGQKAAAPEIDSSALRGCALQAFADALD